MRWNRSLGVGIIVDAVINHTTGVGSGTSTAGSTYTAYNYPQYDPTDFHHCGTNTGDSDPANDNDIDSYNDRAQVQTCELENLADLDTGKAKVQSTLHHYLQALLDMGVAGLRIDAAKHMAAKDIAAILKGLKRPDGSAPYVFQEVIDQGGEPIKSFEYTPNGDVTEFRYSVKLDDVLNCGHGDMSALENILADKNFLPSRLAVVFTDNHDNQRGHGAGGACILDHRDGYALYNLGNIFMLAYPYGYPSVMSIYYWSNDRPTTPATARVRPAPPPPSSPAALRRPPTRPACPRGSTAMSLKASLRRMGKGARAAPSPWTTAGESSIKAWGRWMRWLYTRR